MKSTSRKEGSSECVAGDRPIVLLGYRYTRKSVCDAVDDMRGRKKQRGKGMGMRVTKMKRETKSLL